MLVIHFMRAECLDPTWDPFLPGVSGVSIPWSNITDADLGCFFFFWGVAKEHPRD